MTGMTTTLGVNGGLGGVSGVGTVGTAAQGANLNGFKKRMTLRRRLLQFMPITQQQRPAKHGMCVCMPAATLDCGTSVTSKCYDQNVLNAPRRFFNVGGGMMGGVQGGGVQGGGGGMGGVQGGGFGGQHLMVGAAGVMQRPIQQPMQMPRPVQFGK